MPRVPYTLTRILDLDDDITSVCPWTDGKSVLFKPRFNTEESSFPVDFSFNLSLILAVILEADRNLIQILILIVISIEIALKMMYPVSRNQLEESSFPISSYLLESYLIFKCRYVLRNKVGSSVPLYAFSISYVFFHISYVFFYSHISTEESSFPATRCRQPVCNWHEDSSILFSAILIIPSYTSSIRIGSVHLSKELPNFKSKVFTSPPTVSKR